VEQLRQQNAALAEASRLKSAFLANMSHELRTPLNAIIGFSELLLDEPDAPGDAADRTLHRTYLETIHRSGRHLLALINDVLDLSKVEAGKMELRLDRFDIAAAVEQVANTVEPLAARKRITLSSSAAASGEVVADEAKVKQILYNLLSNAIKFTPDGGRVSVSVQRGANALAVEVADTGIGIAAAEQQRVFQEFHQRLHSGLARCMRDRCCADKRWCNSGRRAAAPQRRCRCPYRQPRPLMRSRRAARRPRPGLRPV